MANSLAAALSEPALYRLLTFHVPSKMSLLLFLLHDASSRNTPPQRSEWGSILPPDCFVSRGSISPMSNNTIYMSENHLCLSTPPCFSKIGCHMLKRKTGQNRFLIGDGQNNGNTRQYRNKTICASCIEKTLIVSFVILLFVYDV